MNKECYQKEVSQIIKELGSDAEKGLSSKEAKKRLERFGPNEIKEIEKTSPVKIFLNQFKSFIVFILLVAVAISIVIKEPLDASTIGVIIVLNAVLGFIQEYKAEKAIEALKKLISLKALVIRDGREAEIDASQLVPGDLIVFETGDKIPADARLIEISNLHIQEAALTGESLPVRKHCNPIMEEVSVADRKNMVFSGTIVVRGRGKAIVVATGMNTEIGKIAKIVQAVKIEKTPLQRKLKILGEMLGIGALAVCGIIFATGALIGISISEIFLTALALAVAAIPEGLPAVVTISLALGIQRMAKRNALIRRLPCVETLGSATVICADKTGTITHNEMTVTRVYANGKEYKVTGSGYSTKGEFICDGRKVEPSELRLILKAGALCNDARIENKTVFGDPTEVALLVSAAKAGLIKEELEVDMPRLAEIEFTSERKRMTTQHLVKGKKVLFCKGAPDVLLDFCDRLYENGEIKRLTRLDKKRIMGVYEKYAKNALRVLGFAYKESKILEEKDMIFIGLQGMIDPPREGVKEAVERCKNAGIKVIMITGDYKLTAEAIARKVGISGKSINGIELDKLKDFDQRVEEFGVYARVDPSHKVKILDALKAKGHIVAMTGDGVNDAPALKKADIGIAMGITGTDVAKEASDVILADDNFVSIVNAVEEGRTVFDNIRKFVQYLLSSNLGEVLVIFVAILLSALTRSFFVPLLALHILWINLATDGLPALALSVEPAAEDVMKRAPRHPKEPIITKSLIYRMLGIGAVMATGTLLTFKAYSGYGADYARTIAFNVLVLYQMFNVLNCRSERKTMLSRRLFKNKKLILAILASVAFQIVLIYTPMNRLFRVVPLSFSSWMVSIGVASSVFFFYEIVKLIGRWKHGKKKS